MDAMLRNIFDRSGGATALARELRISTTAIYKWQEQGIPDERISQVSKICGISRDELRSYSEEKANDRRAGLEWYEPESARKTKRDLEPRPQRPPRSPEEMIEIARAAWHYWDSYPLWRGSSPPPYPRPPDPPPPPPLPTEVMSIITSVELSRDRALLTSFARFLLGGGKCFYLFPKVSPRPDHLHDCGGTGCWLNTATLPLYREIAKHFDMTERYVGNAIVFLASDFTGEVIGPEPPPPPIAERKPLRIRGRFRRIP